MFKASLNFFGTEWKFEGGSLQEVMTRVGNTLQDAANNNLPLEVHVKYEP